MNKLFAFMLGMFVFAIPCNADNGNGDNDDKDKTSTIPVRRTSTPSAPVGGKPHMPSNQIIWISYDRSSETCEFSLPASVDYLYVTFEGEKTGYVYSTDVSVDNTTVSVSLPADYYTITCLSDEGATFYGEGYIN